MKKKDHIEITLEDMLKVAQNISIKAQQNPEKPIDLVEEIENWKTRRKVQND